MRDSWKAMDHVLAAITSGRMEISIKLAGNCITHRLGVRKEGQYRIKNQWNGISTHCLRVQIGQREVGSN